MRLLLVALLLSVGCPVWAGYTAVASSVNLHGYDIYGLTYHHNADSGGLPSPNSVGCFSHPSMAVSALLSVYGYAPLGNRVDVMDAVGVWVASTGDSLLLTVGGTYSRCTGETAGAFPSYAAGVVDPVTAGSTIVLPGDSSGGGGAGTGALTLTDVFAIPTLADAAAAWSAGFLIPMLVSFVAWGVGSLLSVVREAR